MPSSSQKQPTKRVALIEVNGQSQKSKKRCDIAPIERAIDKLEAISVASASKVQSDEFDIYGQYIATQLRLLPTINALTCQEEFQRIITRERIKVLNLQTVSPSPSYYDTSNCATNSSIYISSPSPAASITPSPMPPDYQNQDEQTDILQEAARVLYE